MIALVVLAAILIGSAYRLWHKIGTERRKGWCQALAITAILFLIYAARVVLSGDGGADCEIHIAVSKAVTAP